MGVVVSDIFISYSSKDAEFARVLSKRLQDVGLTVFVDRLELLGGDVWHEVLDREINAAKVVVGLWTNESLASDWPMREFTRAHTTKKLLPIQLEPIEAQAIPLFFEGLHWIGYWDRTEHEWHALLRSIFRRLRTSSSASLVKSHIEGEQTVQNELRPLIGESTTAESTNVEVVLGDLRRGQIVIPDYQRDSQQWGQDTKSLFIESIINNLAIPAFFFEPRTIDGRETNDVVDGQQRLTTLVAFAENDFALVDEDKAPYLSAQCAHYAGRYFEDLPHTFKEAFLRHRLTIIKLRGLGDHRLEVFRRINQGGTPLSGQDIRLAYYGSESPSNAFIRIVGIYDRDRDAARRFLRGAKENYGLEYPWSDQNSYELWNDLWHQKTISIGQTPSEMFLWSLVAACQEKMDDLTKSKELRGHLNIKSSQLIDEVLDLYCAQSQFQDRLPKQAISYVMSVSELRDKYFPFFKSLFVRLVRPENRKLNVAKYRMLAMVIGTAYRLNKKADEITQSQVLKLFQFIDAPRSFAATMELEWPESKGTWSGKKGYAAQLRMAKDIVSKILK